MNVFRIYKGVRRYGPNYGLPMWVIDCGLGTKYTPEVLLSKLVTMGLRDKDWILIRNGLSERGLGEVINAFTYIRCKTEVETSCQYATPGWFSSVTRWTVRWSINPTFTIGALRPRQDIVIIDEPKQEELIDFLTYMQSFKSVDVGVINPPNFDEAWLYRLRLYEKVETEELQC